MSPTVVPSCVQTSEKAVNDAAPVRTNATGFPLPPSTRAAPPTLVSAGNEATVTTSVSVGAVVVVIVVIGPDAANLPVAARRLEQHERRQRRGAEELAAPQGAGMVARSRICHGRGLRQTVITAPAHCVGSNPTRSTGPRPPPRTVPSRRMAYRSMLRVARPEMYSPSSWYFEWCLGH